jgi:hypothetical protein
MQKWLRNNAKLLRNNAKLVTLFAIFPRENVDGTSLNTTLNKRQPNGWKEKPRKGEEKPYPKRVQPQGGC